MAEEKQIRNVRLTEEQIQAEEILSVAIERQSEFPSKTNRDSLLNVLKTSDIYLPAKIVLDDELKEQISKGVKPTQEMLARHSKCIPELVQNSKTGEKAMLVFSKESEMGDRVNDPNYSFIRLPFVNFVRMAENLPEAFIIVLDGYTHPIVCTIDMLLFGIFGEGEDPEAIQET